MSWRRLLRRRALLWPVLVLLLVPCLRLLPRPRRTPFLPDGSYRVLEVIDGDTIVVEGGHRVRFVSVDAPEMNYGRGRPEPLAEEARAAVEALAAASGGRLRLEGCGPPRDRYGRFLKHPYARVGTREVMVEEELVLAGLARVVDYGGGCPHLERLYRAEARARRERRGMWAGGARKR